MVLAVQSSLKQLVDRTLHTPCERDRPGRISGAASQVGGLIFVFPSTFIGVQINVAMQVSDVDGIRRTIS
jgi:hypothetical protein